MLGESDIINSGIDVVPDKITDNNMLSVIILRLKILNLHLINFLQTTLGFGLSYVFTNSCCFAQF